MLTIPAILFSALAFLTGILVIGKGQHFQYTLRDLLRGRDNALLYVWITSSTAFSLAHFAVLMEFGFKYDFLYKDTETAPWMLIHMMVGVLFVLAHLYIRKALAAPTYVSRYIWGSAARV